MNLQDLRIVLQKIGVPDIYLQPYKPNQLIIPCPLAKWTHKKKTDSNPSCSIRYDDPAKPTLFNCFSCKESGKLWYLVHSIGQFAQRPDIEMMGLELTRKDEPTLTARLENIAQGFDDWVFDPKKETLRVLEEHILDHFPKAWHVERARTYLLGRNFRQEHSDFWDLRWHDKSNRIMFPVRNSQGQLVGAVGRGIFEEIQPKYYNFFGFATGLTLGGMHRITKRKKIAVVEGFFDLINAYWMAQATDYDMVCTFTSKTSKQQAELLLAQDSSIHYFYDLDEAGDAGWKIAQELLGPTSFGLKRVEWSNRLLDVGAMDVVQWQYALRGDL